MRRNSFHFLIWSLGVWTLTILCLYSDLIISLGIYNSFVATQYFLNKMDLCQSIEIQPVDFTLIGALGKDYSSYLAVKKAMNTLDTTKDTIKLEYHGLFNSLMLWSEQWSIPVTVAATEPTSEKTYLKSRRIQKRR